MSTFLRRTGIGVLILFGLLTGHGVARAQYSFGMTRYGMNVNNPLVAQQNYIQQYMNQMALVRLAIASGQQVPAALPYLAPYMSPYAAPAYAPPAYMPPGGGYNPYMNYGANPYNPGLGYGANPYTPTSSGYGSNPYSTTSGGGSDPYSSNPYSPSSAALMGGYGMYSNPALGPGYTLMGGADVMRAYGNVITSQEKARMLREQYYQAKLETKKKQFDLDQYIKANTPTFTEEQAKVAKQTLKRIQTTSNPAEIADGRSLNYLLEDVEKYASKTLPDMPLPGGDALTHINVKPAGLDGQSLGLLRDGGKFNWPSALVDLLPADTRKDMQVRALALSQAAIDGKEPDRNALKDLRQQIETALDRLVKKANSYDTGEYMEAKRFLNDLESSRRAIDRGAARAQVQFQQLAKSGKINSLNDLVTVMRENGWRFASALPGDEATYRALHSGMVAYDLALNQLVAQAEP